MPIASARQFIEFAVNMPEHDPQVGQAERSSSSMSLSGTDGSALITIASIRSFFAPLKSPASMGPPETRTAGMFSLMAAMNIPGVILSQLDMQIMASTMCALHMYSTLSAIRSRDGRE